VRIGTAVGREGGDWYIAYSNRDPALNVDIGSKRGVNIGLFAAVWIGTLPP